MTTTRPLSGRRFTARVASNPDVDATPDLMWTARDSTGVAMRSIVRARLNQAEVAYIVSAPAADVASGEVDLLMIAHDLNDTVQAAMTTGRPAWTREPTPGLAQISLERMLTMTHRPLTVFIAGKVWNKTVAVLHTNTRSETAASVWTSTAGKPFEQVHDFMSYDSACLTEDNVCLKLRDAGSGLGFVGLLEQHPSGRVALVVRVPAGRSARVLTAEGDALPVLDADKGSVMPLQSKQPWKVRVLVKAEDGREYQLPIPIGGVVSVS